MKDVTSTSSASYMPGANIPVLTGPENYPTWSTRMRVHFMGIGINLLIHDDVASRLIKGVSNYEAANNKKVASIFVKISDEMMSLIIVTGDLDIYIT